MSVCPEWRKDSEWSSASYLSSFPLFLSRNLVVVVVEGVVERDAVHVDEHVSVGCPGVVGLRWL